MKMILSSISVILFSLSSVAGKPTKDRLAGFPKRAFDQAQAYLKKYPSQFTNKNYLTLVDLSKPSGKKRMYIVNLETGGVESRLTSHGKGSDPQNRNIASVFGNNPGSKKSSLGFYRTLGTYFGSHGLSLQLQGLSPTNNKAYERAVVVHSANYVDEGGRRAGRSYGCFAVDPNYGNKVIQKIKGGSLIYAWSGQ
jgi:L,D-transpeptidase catalytic domain